MAGKKNLKFPVEQQSIKKYMFWLDLVSIQALLSSFWLLSIPKEAGNAIFLGFSFKRLALLIPLILPVIAAMLLKLKLRKNPDKQLWNSDAKKKSRFGSSLTLCGFLLALTMLNAGFLYHFMAIPFDFNIYIRLLPIIIFYFLFGIEAILFVPLTIFPSGNVQVQEKSSFPWLPFGIFFGILTAGLLIVKLTGLGINPVRVSIISLGSPLLEGQIWYIAAVLALLIVFTYAWKCIPDSPHIVFHGKIDLTIALILWIFAVVLWMSLPLPKNNYFAPQVQAPNFEKYPFSDAEQYDFNSLYVYYGNLKDFVISKPLYVSLLALFHAISGLSYEGVIFLQTLLVAIFPAVLFFIGKELHSRMGGIAIALFAIMREVIAIQATSIANISSTKLLLSDMPATLLASILALMLIRWFKSDKKKISGYEFIIGGLIGMFILTRIQTLALIPFFLLLAIFRYYRNFKTIIFSMLILLFAVGLVITPILIRNHAITGVLWIDNPSSSSGLSRIMTEGLDFEDDAFTEYGKMQALQKNTNLIGFLLQNNLADLANFTFDNFFRNGISSILTLPVRMGNRIEFLDFLKIGSPFWMEVYSKPNILNLINFLINFAVIAFGFSVVYKNNPLASLSLLGLFVVYSLSSAVVRLSGWRFILPMDWIFYAFFGFGMLEILKWIFGKLSCSRITVKTGWLTNYLESKESISSSWRSMVMYGCVFIIIGAAIPLRENIFPVLVPEFSKAEACHTIETELKKSENKHLVNGFYDYCFSDQSQMLYGYGIYPRFFESGEGYYDRKSDPWFGQQPYSRLVFRLIGLQSEKVYIRTNESSMKFPNGSLVYVMGSSDQKLGAQVVLVNGSQPELIVSSRILTGKESFSR